jgi:predicted cupin superfamily sugar epimerase
MADRTEQRLMAAREVIEMFDLEPHPEGGHYRETWRGPAGPDGRAVGTAIYFLLARGERAAWHRIDAEEIWHWYAGDPLILTVSENGTDATSTRLGRRLREAEVPQAVVPAGAWQTAKSLGDWTLVGCTVAPGFTFESLELAPLGWQPARRGS